MRKYPALLLATALLLGLCATCSLQNESAPERSSPQAAASDITPAPQEPSSAASSEAPEREAVPEPGKSYLFTVRDTDGTDDGVARLLSAMEREGIPFYRTASAPGGLFSGDDVILLKINCQWDERGGTNTDLIAAVAEAIAAHPDGFSGEIVVADNGQTQYGSNGTGGSLGWENANSADRKQSVLDVVARLKPAMRISGYLWDDIAMTRVAEFSEGDLEDGFVLEDTIRETGLEISYPKFTTEYGTRISFKEGVWDEASQNYDSERLKVINMPVLKVHALYQVTGAVKAYMGTTANRQTVHRAHNSVGTGGMGTQMAGTRIPALNLMDMIWVGAERGPGAKYDNAAEINMIAASADPVALDYWAAKQVLMPEAAKLPGGRESALNPDGTTPGTFGYWLRLSMLELQKSGAAVTMDESAMIVVEAE